MKNWTEKENVLWAAIFLTMGLSLFSVALHYTEVAADAYLYLAFNIVALAFFILSFVTSFVKVKPKDEDKKFANGMD